MVHAAQQLQSRRPHLLQHTCRVVVFPRMHTTCVRHLPGLLPSSHATHTFGFTCSSSDTANATTWGAGRTPAPKSLTHAWSHARASLCTRGAFAWPAAFITLQVNRCGGYKSTPKVATAFIPTGMRRGYGRCASATAVIMHTFGACRGK